MPEVLMDTEETQAHIDKVNESVSEIYEILHQILTKVNAIIPEEWESPSANEFLEGLSDHINRFDPKLEEITELNQRLEKEITQWSETAATF